ncbi:hypothetical protein H4F17_06035 [Vibrio cholerae]
MDVCQVTKGMMVECAEGRGEVLVVDRQTNIALIQDPKSGFQFAALVSELANVRESYGE